MFLPGESQGRGRLVGCHLRGRTESDTTEVTYQQQQKFNYVYSIATLSFLKQLSKNFMNEALRHKWFM